MAVDVLLVSAGALFAAESVDFAAAGAADFVPSDFLPEYPSLYQPPPCRWKEGAESLRATLPDFPHTVQVVRGFSLNFCMASNSLPQALQTYS